MKVRTLELAIPKVVRDGRRWAAQLGAARFRSSCPACVYFAVTRAIVARFGAA